MGIMFLGKIVQRHYCGNAVYVCNEVGDCQQKQNDGKTSLPQLQSLCISYDFFPLFSTARYEKTHFPNDACYVKSKKEHIRQETRCIEQKNLDSIQFLWQHNQKKSLYRHDPKKSLDARASLK